MKTKHQGFTLIEIAIVIAIIGFITAGLLSGMGSIRESAKFNDDKQKLQDIRSALLSYAAVNGNLPCPDTDNDGLENRSPGTLGAEGACTSTTGLLPYLYLNTHARNTYGFAFSYLVNNQANSLAETQDRNSSASYFGKNCIAPCFNTATPPVAGDTIADLGNYRITTGVNTLANQVPVVVISHGKDLKDSTTCNSSSNFEVWNCDLTQTQDNQTLIYQAQQGNGFDDIILWLTSLEIKKITPGIIDNLIQNINKTQQLAFIPIMPADDVNSVSFTQTIQGDAGFSSNSSTDDSVKVVNNLTAEVNLANGTDVLYVMGDVNAVISAGNQSKTLYIEGDQNASITLGGGNAVHKIHITGHSNADITTGSASRTDLIIEKNVTANVTLGGSNNAVFIGGDILGRLDGNGIVYLNKLYDVVTTDEFNRISGSFSTTGNAKCRVSFDSTAWRNCEPT